MIDPKPKWMWLSATAVGRFKQAALHRLGFGSLVKMMCTFTLYWVLSNLVGSLATNYMQSHVDTNHITTSKKPTPSLSLVDNVAPRGVSFRSPVGLPAEWKQKKAIEPAALRTRGDWNLRRIITKYGNSDDYHQDEHLVSRLYALLKPIPTLQGRIDAFSITNNISSCVGMHIRRTDMVEKNGTEWWKGVGSDHNDTASTSNRPSSHLSIINDSDDTFLNLVKDHLKENSKQRFFLATDNRTTQLKFETADFPQGTIFSAGVIAPPRPESSRDNIVVYRHTSLDRAVMDVHLLVRCREFHGSRGSSFSTLVGRLKQASSDLHQEGALEERRQS